MAPRKSKQDMPKLPELPSGENQIVYMDPNLLVPYENNPRLNAEAVDYVANSIKEFGFRNPIIVDRDMVIIAGHTRQKASLKLGLEKVPVIIAKDMTDDQARAFRLADNKTAEISGWDFDALDIELGEIGDLFDMSDFGFDLGDEIVEGAEEDNEEEVVDTRLATPSVDSTIEFNVVITCDGESQQQELFERLTQEGYKCRLSM